ncbi:MAG: orotidine-5'-phosphate decarboxylase [Nitrososphaerales archaeon]
MSDDFRERLKESSKKHQSRIVLALDIDYIDRDRAIIFAKNSINLLKEYICGVKINFHLILPLDLYSEVKQVTDLAHSHNLQAIADVKLNDIGNTNKIALTHLWASGFDAATVSSFIGFDGLRETISHAHENRNGLIALVYMSHKSAGDTYGLEIIDPKSGKTMQMYNLFLRWAEELNADGIIVGATVPEVIKHCSERIKNNVFIFSPGIGRQGGDPRQALANGADYIIVGRSILESKEPDKEAEKLRNFTWEIASN